MALPGEDDQAALTRVGDVIAAAIAEKKPIPLRARVETLDYPTVEQWLLAWLPTKKRIKRNTYRGYESHVRLYLVPHLGAIRLDKLRVAHISDMFDAIVEHNAEIRAARAGKDPKRREAVKYQRPVDAAKWVEMPPADRPKPLVWTDDSAATVALDADTVLILRAHRKGQNAEREAAGITWVETGLVFTREDGSPLHPADVTEHFKFLPARPGCRRSGCTTCVTAPRPSPSRPGWR